MFNQRRNRLSSFNLFLDIIRRLRDFLSQSKEFFPNYDFNRKLPKYSNLEFYDENREDLKGFIFKFKIKLRHNVDWFPQEVDEVIYFVGRLKNKAELRILLLIQFIQVFIETIIEFYKALNTAFDNPNKKAIALRYIQKFRQINRPFYQYLADFESRVYEFDLNERNSRQYFMNNLAHELQDAIVIYRNDLIIFTQLKEQLQFMDNQMRRNTAFRKGNPFVNLPKIFIITIITSVNKFINDGNIVMNLS